MIDMKVLKSIKLIYTDIVVVIRYVVKAKKGEKA